MTTTPVIKTQKDCQSEFAVVLHKTYKIARRIVDGVTDSEVEIEIGRWLHSEHTQQRPSCLRCHNWRDFKAILPELQTALDEASFLSIDGEFTGLGSADLNTSAMDTPKERYHKLRQSSMDFLFVQFGLCAFKYDAEAEKYICKAYNFYVFPRPFSRQAPDVRFTCQSSSVQFLMSQGFNFNKVFNEGIPYLLPADEQKLKDALAKKHALLDSRVLSSPAFTSPAMEPVLNKGPIHVPEEHKEFVDSIVEKVGEFLKSDGESLDLLPCNGYQRKLLFQTLSLKFPSQVHLEAKTGEDRQRFIVVTRVKGEDDFRKLEEAKRAAEFEEIDDAVGFSKVIKMISKSKKLVIGHNMLLDVLHVLHKFSCPLPEDYDDFKSVISCILPRLLDTKLMASTHPFKDMFYTTALGDLQKLLEQKPFVKPNVVVTEGFPGYDTAKEQLHEAGYDAYITGLCFITMANYLGTYQDPKLTHVPAGSPLIEPFVNKIFLMRVYDIPYLNFAGEELSPDRDHVFHITFPREWKYNDITQLFSPFGPVSVSWIDETSGFVSLHFKDKAEQVLQSLSNGEHYRIQKYADHTRRRSLDSSSGSLKRKLPASDIDLPTIKRKRSIESSHRSFETIPEEDESMEEEKSGSNGKKIVDDIVSDIVFEIGAPPKFKTPNTTPLKDEVPAKKMRKDTVTPPKDEVPAKKMRKDVTPPKDAMFEVPDTW